MTELVTERLELRPWREDDLDAYAEIAGDADVARYMGGPPMDRAGAWRQMAIFIGHRQLRGYTQSAVTERATGELVGRGGLWRPEGWPGLEVGWVIHPSRWGLGYAAEFGRAARDHAFTVLGADHLISVIHAENAASIRVAEKIGSSYERDYELNGIGCVIYGQANPAA